MAETKSGKAAADAAVVDENTTVSSGQGPVAKEPVNEGDAKPAAPADATVRPEGQDPRVDDAPEGATPEQQVEDSERFVDGMVAQLEGRQLQPAAAHRLIQAVRATKV